MRHRRGHPWCDFGYADIADIMVDQRLTPGKPGSLVKDQHLLAVMIKGVDLGLRVRPSTDRGNSRADASRSSLGKALRRDETAQSRIGEIAPIDVEPRVERHGVPNRVRDCHFTLKPHTS